MRTAQPLVGRVLATRGDLLFVGEGNGSFKAFDSRSGDRLWQFQCEAGVNAPPVTYRIDGKQYVAVAVGGRATWFTRSRSTTSRPVSGR